MRKCFALFPCAFALILALVSPALAQTCAEIVDANHILYEGTVYRCIDNEGVYFIDEAAHAGIPFPPTTVSLYDVIGERKCLQPVRVQIVDSIDCTGTSHGFVDTDANHPNPSRVLNLNGKNYRVTAPPTGFTLNYFAYYATVNPVPGTPYLLVAETPNDRERYTGISLTHPWGTDWAPPYTGIDVCEGDCIGTCQEGNCFNPDVGLTTYTGREYPVDGNPFNISFLFYPKSNQVKVTVSSSGWQLTSDSGNGGAVSRIWVYRVLDPLDTRQPELDVDAGNDERRVGIYMTHPWYFYGHYGIPRNTLAQRQASLQNMIDTMKFCGFNWIEYNAINGSDRSGVAWYVSDYFPQVGGNLLHELSPLAEAEGMGVVPVITSLLIPGSLGGMPTHPDFTFTDDSFQRLTDGSSFTQAFNGRSPDPLRPEVQAWLIHFLTEIGNQVAPYPAVKGIGFRANGKIGLCYHAHQDGWRGAEESGYSSWDVQQYKNATGSGVPTTPGQAYDWLRARPAEWEAWINFRCERTRDLWLAARDAIRAIRPDWTLYVKTVLPSEVPGTNIDWPGEDVYDLLRFHGYDPLMFTNEDGIVVERSMMVDADRFFTSVKWGPPWGANSDRFRTFHYTPGLPGLYETLAGNAVELYHNYWEEAFHPDVEFGDFVNGFRTNTATGPGRSFYQPATFSIREANVDTIAFMGWERPIMGHEHDLRAFSQSFRALPKVDPADFTGTVSPSIAEVWVKWFGDRLAIVNDDPAARDISITFPTPIPSGMEVRDVARGKVFLTSLETPRDSITVDADAWSLQTLRIAEPPTPVPTPTVTPTFPTFTPTNTYPTYTPTATPTVGELLNNWGFEDDGAPWVFPPVAWGGWGDDNPDGTTPQGYWGAGSFYFVPHGGEYGCGKTTNWGTTTSAGVYQVVTVSPGIEYECTAFAWTPKDFGSGGAEVVGEVRVGVDLTGGTLPASGSVQWTPWGSYRDAWTQIGFMGDGAVTATGPALTLFLEYRQLTATAWNGMFFDDVSVQQRAPVAGTETATPTPSLTTTPVPSSTPTPTGTRTPTSTPVPTNTPIPTSTRTATNTPTNTPGPPAVNHYLIY